MRSKRCSRRPLLWVKGGDQQRLARVSERDTLALDDVFTLREHGEQQVGDAIVQKVDFVDVQNPSVRLRKRPGWKTVFPCFIDSSMSTVPMRRSSVTPKGSCTNGASRMMV